MECDGCPGDSNEIGISKQDGPTRQGETGVDDGDMEGLLEYPTLGHLMYRLGQQSCNYHVIRNKAGPQISQGTNQLANQIVLIPRVDLQRSKRLPR